MFRIVSAVALAAALVTPALADQTDGIVASFDGRTGVLVMDDRTVWTLPAASLPVDLTVGARIRIEFEGLGENGAAPQAIVLLPLASPEDDA